MLDFYQKVKEQQLKATGSLRLDPILLKKGWKDLLVKEGFPLLQRRDFPLDLEGSIHLFHSLCKIAKDANPYMSTQVKRIKESLTKKNIDLEKLLKEGLEGKKIQKFADQLEVDQRVLTFLIQQSLKPSIESDAEQAIREVDLEAWLKGSCPICGSLPYLSLLKDETGKRYLFCSFCGCQWRFERLGCPFCDNRDQASLLYFYEEGEKNHRIDVCDQCHQYIKTIDLRELESFDPDLEDLGTLHLDLLASQKGYRRPTPNPWSN
jgi:FdhE protein